MTLATPTPLVDLVVPVEVDQRHGRPMAARIAWRRTAAIDSTARWGIWVVPGSTYVGPIVRVNGSSSAEHLRAGVHDVINICTVQLIN